MCNLKKRNNIQVSAEDYLDGIVAAVQSFLTKKGMHEKHVARVVISSLDQILATVAELTSSRPASIGTMQCAAMRVAAFILQLKHLIRACTTCRCSLHITVNPSSVTSPQLVARLRQVADTVLSVESFAGRTHSVPYEFKEFQGFLVVHKIQQYGSMAPFRPPGTRFGLKRDRRKLHIEPLHLPPEESRAFSTTGGAQTSSISADKEASHSNSSGLHQSRLAAGMSAMSVKEGGGSSAAASASSGSGSGSTLLSAAASANAVSAQGSTTHHPVGTAAAPSPSGAGAPAPLTPLQASLAALKAARAAASSSSSAAVAVAGSAAEQSAPAPTRVAPISIQRSAPAVAAAVVVKENKPPLQPGQACGASTRGSQDSKYDF